MMEEENTWIEQLKIMQSNIQSLFEGVIKEKNDYKEGNDFLSASLKQMIGRIDNLERQNEMLRKCNASMRNIFSVGLKTFRKLDLSCVNSIKDNRVSLELLQKLFLESSEKIEVKSVLNNKTQLSSVGQKNEDVDGIRTEMHEDRIKIKKCGFENANPPTLVVTETEDGRDEKGQELNSPEDILRNVAGKKPQSADGVKRRLMHQGDATNFEQADSTICKPAEPPPPTNGNVIGSPVFKDARKQDPARIEESKSSKSPTLKLINEKFVEKSAQLLISPWKSQQADGSSTSKGQFTPKRGKSESKFSSPSRSPSTALRRPNSKEGDPGSAGGRKLTQTFLNIDCFKQKNPLAAKNSRNDEEGNASKRTRLYNIDDDDLIFDSPKPGNKGLASVKEEVKNENESRCLDETFISSPTIRQFHSEHNQIVEGTVRNQSTNSRPRQKSPECDSVPFVYQREAIRKKEERMKLPGHPCVECDKYYKNADINTEDLEKILNKCSRHRDKNPPALNDTPPGYWKPYLTCTNIFSPNKRDSR